MPTQPSAKEITTAATKKGIEAIPYLDLREAGKREYQRQKEACQNYSCDKLSTDAEISAALVRASDCFELRCNVRTIFKQAIGRVKAALQGMKAGVPLKPELEKILKELEASERGHTNAVTEVNNAILKGKEKLGKLKG